MICCAGIEWEEDIEISGKCEKCGAETVDGNAYESCAYSPVVCEECGYAPNK